MEGSRISEISFAEVLHRFIDWTIQHDSIKRKTHNHTKFQSSHSSNPD